MWWRKEINKLKITKNHFYLHLNAHISKWDSLISSFHFLVKHSSFLICGILSHMDQTLLSHSGCEKLPTSTFLFIRESPLLIFDIHYYAIVMVQVWRAIFERVWILKLFVENFYLLVLFSHVSMASIMRFHPCIYILS